MNQLSILPVTGNKAIETAAALAADIWREHYTPIIGKPQVEYMIANFQSKEAIARQIKEGYIYYLARDTQGADIGYFAVVPKEKELFLSKIYLVCAARGKGYARQMLEFIKALARERNLPRITLTVNKNNHNSIKAYQKMGFTITASLVTDIGHGFVMDDYAMELKLGDRE